METTKNKVTLTTLAQALRLAPSTVSVCLSGKSAQYGVKPETVRRVCEYAAKAGYVPNSAARQLRGNRMPPVGLLFDQNIHAGEMIFKALNPALTALREGHRETRVVGSENFADGIIQLRELGCEEIIVFSKIVESPGTPDELQQSLNAFLNASGNVTIYAVNYNFSDREHFLLPRMFRLGIHRQKIYAGLVNLLQRLGGGPVLQILWDGYDPASHADFLPPHPELQEYPYMLGRAWAADYLKLRRQRRFAAIAIGDDRTAAALMAELIAQGVKIPEEVRIISFDNLDFGECLPVPLTSWGVPLWRHTQLVLHAILDGKEIPARVMSIPDFNWRQSAGIPEVEQRQFERWCEATLAAEPHMPSIS